MRSISTDDKITNDSSKTISAGFQCKSGDCPSNSSPTEDESSISTTQQFDLTSFELGHHSEYQTSSMENELKLNCSDEIFNFAECDVQTCDENLDKLENSIANSNCSHNDEIFGFPDCHDKTCDDNLDKLHDIIPNSNCPPNDEIFNFLDSHAQNYDENLDNLLSIVSNSNSSPKDVGLATDEIQVIKNNSKNATKNPVISPKFKDQWSPSSCQQSQYVRRKRYNSQIDSDDVDQNPVISEIHYLASSLGEDLLLSSTDRQNLEHSLHDKQLNHPVNSHITYSSFDQNQADENCYLMTHAEEDLLPSANGHNYDHSWHSKQPTRPLDSDDAHSTVDQNQVIIGPLTNENHYLMTSLNENLLASANRQNLDHYSHGKQLTHSLDSHDDHSGIDQNQVKNGNRYLMIHSNENLVPSVSKQNLDHLMHNKQITHPLLDSHDDTSGMDQSQVSNENRYAMTNSNEDLLTPKNGQNFDLPFYGKQITHPLLDSHDDDSSVDQNQVIDENRYLIINTNKDLLPSESRLNLEHALDGKQITQPLLDSRGNSSCNDQNQIFVENSNRYLINNSNQDLLPSVSEQNLDYSLHSKQITHPLLDSHASNSSIDQNQVETKNRHLLTNSSKQLPVSSISEQNLDYSWHNKQLTHPMSESHDDLSSLDQNHAISENSNGYLMTYSNEGLLIPSTSDRNLDHSLHSNQPTHPLLDSCVDNSTLHRHQSRLDNRGNNLYRESSRPENRHSTPNGKFSRSQALMPKCGLYSGRAQSSRKKDRPRINQESVNGYSYQNESARHGYSKSNPLSNEDNFKKRSPNCYCSCHGSNRSSYDEGNDTYISARLNYSNSTKTNENHDPNVSLDDDIYLISSGQSAKNDALKISASLNHSNSTKVNLNGRQNSSLEDDIYFISSSNSTVNFTPPKSRKRQIIDISDSTSSSVSSNKVSKYASNLSKESRNESLSQKATLERDNSAHISYNSDASDANTTSQKDEVQHHPQSIPIWLRNPLLRTNKCKNFCQLATEIACSRQSDHPLPAFPTDNSGSSQVMNAVSNASWQQNRAQHGLSLTRNNISYSPMDIADANSTDPGTHSQENAQSSNHTGLNGNVTFRNGCQLITGDKKTGKNRIQYEIDSTKAKPCRTRRSSKARTSGEKRCENTEEKSKKKKDDK
ncbi:hypothetical protein TrispH2_007406 [Trichoplax sp. H2]|nr:hypothetical protein TrispH2_007406 [Trichoplax sp. H2]|eukprot:RDD40861.1 hypothetical protein TrispH2_007406 [Trichoplax sp. H2]